MDMILQLLLLVLGFALLIFGGDNLVKGAIGLARRFNVSAKTIGLTVVAAGTSAPELFTSSLASLRGAGDLAVGNVVGSNIFNILGVLGITSLISVTDFPIKKMASDWTLTVLISGLFVFLGTDLVFQRGEGLFFLGLFLAFLVYAVKSGKEPDTEIPSDAQRLPLWKSTSILAMGIILLTLGAEAVVRSAQWLGLYWGLSERVIAVSLVAFGTSLPELATSFVAALKKQGDIAISNILGSNIFNILLIIGVAGSISPLAISSELFGLDIFVMMGAVLILLPLAALGKGQLGKKSGAFFLIVQIAYLYLLLFRAPVL